MLKKLFSPKKDDICPNCGTACFATDILCPRCGKNLDELFEQLPDLKGSQNLFQETSKHLSFLNWLTPLFLILSPLVVGLVTMLGFAPYTRSILDQSPLQLMGNVVPSATRVSFGSLVISVIPLFLCTVSCIRSKLDPHFVVILVALLSSLSVMSLWTSLRTAYMMSAYHFAALLGIDIFWISPYWLNALCASGTVLVVLNLITVIGQEATA